MLFVQRSSQHLGFLAVMVVLGSLPAMANPTSTATKAAEVQTATKAAEVTTATKAVEVKTATDTAPPESVSKPVATATKTATAPLTVTSSVGKTKTTTSAASKKDEKAKPAGQKTAADDESKHFVSVWSVSSQFEKNAGLQRIVDKEQRMYEARIDLREYMCTRKIDGSPCGNYVSFYKWLPGAKEGQFMFGQTWRDLDISTDLRIQRGVVEIWRKQYESLESIGFDGEEIRSIYAWGSAGITGVILHKTVVAPLARKSWPFLITPAAKAGRWIMNSAVGSMLASKIPLANRVGVMFEKVANSKVVVPYVTAGLKNFITWHSAAKHPTMSFIVITSIDIGVFGLMFHNWSAEVMDNRFYKPEEKERLALYNFFHKVKLFAGMTQEEYAEYLYGEEGAKKLLAEKQKAEKQGDSQAQKESDVPSATGAGPHGDFDRTEKEHQERVANYNKSRANILGDSSDAGVSGSNADAGAVDAQAIQVVPAKNQTVVDGGIVLEAGTKGSTVTLQVGSSSVALDTPGHNSKEVAELAAANGNKPVAIFQLPTGFRLHSLGDDTRDKGQRKDLSPEEESELQLDAFEKALWNYHNEYSREYSDGNFNY
ncbi:MAG: hypothetical protein AB1540_12275 [Bdellovibrionota bacterium]